MDLLFTNIDEPYSKVKWIWYDMWGFDFAFGHPKALRAVTLEMIWEGMPWRLNFPDFKGPQILISPL